MRKCSTCGGTWLEGPGVDHLRGIDAPVPDRRAPVGDQEAVGSVWVFCAPYSVTMDDQYRTQPAAPASAAEVRAALASARR